MNAAVQTRPQWEALGRAWWPLALGLLSVLAIGYYRFATGIWEIAGNDHAPILIAIALFLFWHHREALLQARVPARQWPALALLAAGILLLLFGARTKIDSFEAQAHVLLVAGSLWLLGGAETLRRFWFPLLFMMLSIPLPSFLLSMATGGLKELVSAAAVDALYRMGLPVARDGVVMTVGPYQLLVAEACSGMNSIISLSSVGILYLYFKSFPRLWQLVLALAVILPIAITANIVRIILLCLITYYLGDEAGQGFLHEFAGMLMFILALAGMFAFTALLEKFSFQPGNKESAEGTFAQTRLAPGSAQEGSHG